ncbi:MAG: peptide-modifying radical SAM enzyme CbpB, partial [Candidatus Omnitrophica bacterium]|nr:peptide-modifying radical SAM enzyme CbpB [Candidatus Omnitrophota bacterium]
MSNHETEMHRVAAPSRGRYANSGNGQSLCPIDIGHAKHIALIPPDTAFWALVPKDRLIDTLSNPEFLSTCRRKTAQFAEEMHALRFGLKPSAVYFNATERCNLNCAYCYIPAKMRRSGKHMSARNIIDALHRLKAYFDKTVPKGVKPQIVFHGAEPLLNRDAIFAAIEKYGRQFRFGIQTNATLLDGDAITFLKTHGVGIGLSLDGHTAAICDRTRATWKGIGIFDRVVKAMDDLRGYDSYNVICTITRKNVRHLTRIVEFFHAHEVPACMLNIVRCTLPSSRDVKPSDQTAAKHFIAALDHTYELYRKTNRKLVVANFANVLVSIIAPTARRLMCDI